jgi:hypothetical protein
MTEVGACGICGSIDLAPLLDMGNQPLAERFDDNRTYPLVLLQCEDCSLVQLSHIVDQQVMFPENHPYTTGTNASMRKHFGELAKSLLKDLREGDVVVDIGANDGTFLSGFQNEWVRSDGSNFDGGTLKLIAVEPTGQARKCRDMHMATYQDFFTAELAAKITGTWGKAKAVTACNVLAHVPSPHDFVAGVAELLADDGEFITESHDFASISDGLQIDTIYHEHLRYYSVASLSRLLAMHGLEVTSSQRIHTYGGSFRVRARKARGGLQDRARAAASDLRRLLFLLDADGNSIYGISAATRATPLIHFARIAPFINRVCEHPHSEKIGSLMPGTQIPVVDEAMLVEDQPDYAVLFSYHLADVIIPKVRQLGYKGKIIIPLPEPVIIGE